MAGKAGTGGKKRPKHGDRCNTDAKEAMRKKRKAERHAKRLDKMAKRREVKPDLKKAYDERMSTRVRVLEDPKRSIIRSKREERQHQTTKPKEV